MERKFVDKIKHSPIGTGGPYNLNTCITYRYFIVPTSKPKETGEYTKSLYVKGDLVGYEFVIDEAWIEKFDFDDLGSINLANKSDIIFGESEMHGLKNLDRLTQNNPYDWEAFDRTLTEFIGKSIIVYSSKPLEKETVVVCHFPSFLKYQK